MLLVSQVDIEPERNLASPAPALIMAPSWPCTRIPPAHAGQRGGCACVCETGRRQQSSRQLQLRELFWLQTNEVETRLQTIRGERSLLGTEWLLAPSPAPRVHAEFCNVRERAPPPRPRSPFRSESAPLGCPRKLSPAPRQAEPRHRHFREAKAARQAEEGRAASTPRPRAAPRGTGLGSRGVFCSGQRLRSGLSRSRLKRCRRAQGDSARGSGLPLRPLRTDGAGKEAAPGPAPPGVPPLRASGHARLAVASGPSLPATYPRSTAGRRGGAGGGAQAHAATPSRPAAPAACRRSRRPPTAPQRLRPWQRSALARPAPLAGDEAPPRAPPSPLLAGAPWPPCAPSRSGWQAGSHSRRAGWPVLPAPLRHRDPSRRCFSPAYGDSEPRRRRLPPQRRKQAGRGAWLAPSGPPSRQAGREVPIRGSPSPHACFGRNPGAPAPFGGWADPAPREAPSRDLQAKGTPAPAAGFCRVMRSFRRFLFSGARQGPFPTWQRIKETPGRASSPPPPGALSALRALRVPAWRRRWSGPRNRALGAETCSRPRRTLGSHVPACTGAIRPQDRASGQPTPAAPLFPAEYGCGGGAAGKRSQPNSQGLGLQLPPAWPEAGPMGEGRPGPAAAADRVPPIAAEGRVSHQQHKQSQAASGPRTPGLWPGRAAPEREREAGKTASVRAAPARPSRREERGLPGSPGRLIPHAVP